MATKIKIKNIGRNPIDGGINLERYYISPGQEAEISHAYYLNLKEYSPDTFEVIEKEEKPIVPAEIVPEPPRADFNFVCTLWASDGMGRVGEELLNAFDELGLKVNVVPHILVEDGLKAKTKELLTRKYLASEKTLFYAIPEVLEKYATKENYLHVPWDTTRAPDIWVENMNKYATKVYPCSDFTREVFERSGVTVPMKTIRHGVDTNSFPYLERNWAKEFYFLTIGNISQRKGTDVLIKAFQKAFPNQRDVGLIIKSNKSMSWGNIDEPIDSRIQVITDTFNQDELLSLFEKAHCYVAPSKAEGFCLPAVEAMSTGMGLIIHNWSAMSMMANDKYNYPIGSWNEIKAPEWMYPKEYSEGGGIGNWCEPDEDKLAEMLKYCYQRRNEVKNKGYLASKWVRTNWKWEDSAKELWTEMNEKEKQTWGKFYQRSTLTVNNAQDSINSHKELFWLIRGFYPETVIEIGTGTGEMAGFLTWDKQEVLGKEPTAYHSEKVIAIDNDKEVLKLAKTNLESIGGKKVELVYADAFKYKKKANLIFAQGLLEHLSNEDMLALVKHELTQTPVVIHSVPNNSYGKLDYGNERLLSEKEYYSIFKGFDLTIYPYWDEDGVKKQSILIFKKTIPFKVSLIMLVYNNKDMTIEAIEAIRKNTKDYELIVIDNNSNDGIELWLDQQKDIRTVHLDSNYGVPKPKNLAISLAKGKYVCFIDNDTVAGKNWLEPMIELLESDKTIGFTAHEGYKIDLDLHSFNHLKFLEKENIDWAAHSIFVFRRESIKETGMLIDRDKWCLEDVDQCLHFKSLGYKGKLPDKQPNIVHYGSVTAKKDSFFQNSERWSELAAMVWKDWDGVIKNQTQGIKLDIGVGDAPVEGYVHVDIQKIRDVEIVADARKIPLEDGSVGELRSSHLIEHFTRNQVPIVLREWHRLLEPNGIIRIIVPDLVKVCGQIVKGDITLEQGMLWIFGGHRDEYDIHHWGYTAEILETLLIDSGFVDFQRVDNKQGWLEVTARKPQKEKLRPKVGYFMTHHHIMGGGENHTFMVLKNITDIYKNVEVISEDWFVNPNTAFGLDLPTINRKESKDYDVFINMSHSKLAEPIGRKNIAMIFYPQYDWSESIKKYDKVVTISEFCRNEIKRKWNVDSEVIYPSLDFTKYRKGIKKNQILCVGRFFRVPDGNNKNQHILLETFKKLPPGYKLIFVGSVQDREYFESVQKEARGLNVEFKQEVPFNELVQLYAESKFLWHAAGYGTELASSFEHFGIVAVEALVSDCRALVFNAGGIAQIEGVEKWNTIDELVSLTLEDKYHKPPNLNKYSMEYARQQWKGLINGCLK